MLRQFAFTEGEYYHIYNRGVDKRVIFSNRSDYQRFIKTLYLGNSLRPFVIRDITEKNVFEIDRGKSLVDIGAFVLMPNHFHLVIRERSSSGTTLFMKKILTAYSMYFNAKYQRTGALFQGRFRAKHITEDTYLQHLITYLHLNPLGIRNRTVENMLSYPYSSLIDHLNEKRPERAILNLIQFPKYHQSKKEIIRNLKDWENIRAEFEDEHEPLPF